MGRKRKKIIRWNIQYTMVQYTIYNDFSSKVFLFDRRKTEWFSIYLVECISRRRNY